MGPHTPAGDHGFHLGDHDGFFAKHTLFDAATRVPFIVRTPDLHALNTAGAVTNTPVE
jgi:arylsulfatase A-like enzyme